MVPAPFDAFAAALLPAELSSGGRAQIEALARPCQAPATGTLLDQNEDTLVFLVAGAAKLVAYASHDREQVVAFHFGHEVIWMPASGSHSCTLVALRDCEALAFPADAFLNLASERSALMIKVIRSALASIDRSRETSIVLGRKTACERVASFLVSMVERIGLPKANRCTLRLPMSRRDIADSLGLTIETISRQLGELRGNGLIETSGRSTIRVLDLQELAKIAGHAAK